MSKKVLVCQNTTCKQQGSDQVLAAFEQALSVEGSSQITAEPSGCLGQCGNGPMVLVTVEKIWYSKVQVRDVPVLVKQHLLGDRPVTHKLYRQMHAQRSSQKNSIWIWVIGFALFMAFCVAIAVIIGRQSYYV